MKKLLFMCVCGGFLSSAAIAADPYEKWLAIQSQRGTEIELIRVASEKPLVDTEESDTEVASILDEVDALESDIDEQEKLEDPE